MADDDITDLIDEELGAEDLEDKIFGASDPEEKMVDGGVVGGPLINFTEPTFAMPVSRATQVCLRGPCCHYWALTCRYVSPGDEMHLGRARTCIRHAQETELKGTNIFHCTQWWPAWLGFVPDWLRNWMRPALVKYYERYLVRAGYDMSWKFWPDWVFESDEQEWRKHQGIGEPRPELRKFFEAYKKSQGR